MNKLPKGLYPVMLTPFCEDFSLDIKALEELTEFYISAGAHGLFANCLSSEMFQLTDEERILITETVVKKVNGRIPVVSSGTFGKALDKNRDFIQKIFDTGVQAVVINSNQLVDSKEDEAVFKAKTEALLESTGKIPLGIYECPVPYKRIISVELTKWMGATGRFLYLKDTTCNLNEIKEKVAVTAKTPLGLFNAHTPTGLASLQHGASGLSPVGANYYPELYAYMIRNIDSKKDEADKTEKLLTLLDTTADSNIYPLSAKIFLKRRGLNILPVTRTKLPAPAKNDLMKLDAMMKAFYEKSEELGINLVSV